ncbi:hypothetical protein BU24DRAFT_226876 [Aaosphaeria arxii CBS 175.79]|uniref:Uncharacterized protein n=1 Tax=Aaosphaeria arxii CBS 175.79 TaxID=1450172 RepID=A0A6A5XQI4_9PLEO|nr:uncharacterized protein BU24DRAFT_226876 [Aaosphaeria arxii CBS 175.79]KAF2015021.1 hypothetical protein BU24DRAFT_226876 [Aaosphaeria arxii CBS 175.79]
MRAHLLLVARRKHSNLCVAPVRQPVHQSASSHTRNNDKPTHPLSASPATSSPGVPCLANASRINPHPLNPKLPTPISLSILSSILLTIPSNPSSPSSPPPPLFALAANTAIAPTSITLLLVVAFSPSSICLTSTPVPVSRLQ